MTILGIGHVPVCFGSTDTGILYIEKGALEEATQRAAIEKKHMLVAFLGEGWSVNCKKFKESVLDTPEFREFAEKYLIYFPVEARRKPKLSSDETAVLQSWVVHFDIKSYPTVILIAPDGQEVLRHGYRELVVKDYMQLLQAILPEIEP